MAIQPDTRQLLRAGIGIFGTGAVCAVLALMVAMGCLPTGALTLALAISKVIGDRKRQRRAARGSEG